MHRQGYGAPKDDDEHEGSDEEEEMALLDMDSSADDSVGDDNEAMDIDQRPAAQSADAAGAAAANENMATPQLQPGT